MNAHSLAAYHEANHIPVPLTFPPIQTESRVKYIDFLARFIRQVFHYAPYFPNEEKQFMSAFSGEGNNLRVVKTGHQLSKEQASLFKAMKSLFAYHVIQKEQLEISSYLSFPLTRLKDLNEKTSNASSVACPLQNNVCLLPDDIWTLIFGYACTSWQDIGHLSLTCRSFYEIAASDRFLKLFFEKNPQAFDEIKHAPLSLKIMDSAQFNPSHLLPRQTSLSDQELLFLASHGENLETLALQGGGFTVRGLAHLLQKCPLLKTLEFHHLASSHFDDYLTVVALYAPQLEHLKIIDCPLTDHALIAFSICKHRLRSFECWDTSGEGALTDCGFSTFISESQHLEVVKLTGFPHVSQFPLLLLEAYTAEGTKKKSEAIKELTFAYCGLCDVGLFEAIVGSFPNLESLEIALSPANYSIDDSKVAFIAIAQACLNLRRVKLSDCTYLDSLTIEKFLSHRPTIEHLELYRSNPSTPSFFSAVAKLPSLKTFQFEPSRQSKSPFTWQPGTFKHLETLGLNLCQIEEHHLVDALKTTQPKLKHLRLFNCGQYTNQLLETLATHCPELVLLEIEQASPAKHSSMLNDAGIQALSTGCQKLETLNLKSPSPSWQFSDDSLAALSNCQRLAHLTLSHFKTSLSECSFNTINLFNKRCINITHLGFPFSDLMDESLIPLFTKNAHQLQSIDLKQVTGKIDLLKDLVLNSPNLQVLEIDHEHMRKKYIQKLKTLSQLTIIYTRQLSTKTSNPSLPSSPTLFSTWTKAARK
ncbi:F-box/LRR-repeat protein 13 [Candidatus Protochlamydia naegleriophila]|uniref:F-box/LRR-repeat protein 13 n=1 Tax=Candidatus Protochlamydia naegleriophila TaxID=389348 RepID=A0A0U5EUA9_9BACT|nr:F-box protein [Candidatus Protochlamydia naegleriophila]CUI17824.1 F-box/LRR-repeat protein 13 [Candidatus Protochlamydia naegleriophila]